MELGFGPWPFYSLPGKVRRDGLRRIILDFVFKRDPSSLKELGIRRAFPRFRAQSRGWEPGSSKEGNSNSIYLDLGTFFTGLAQGYWGKNGGKNEGIG